MDLLGYESDDAVGEPVPAREGAAGALPSATSALAAASSAAPSFLSAFAPAPSSIDYRAIQADLEATRKRELVAAEAREARR